MNKFPIHGFSVKPRSAWHVAFIVCVRACQRRIWFLMIFNLFISKGDIANRALIKQPATKKGHIYYYIWSEIDHSNDTKSSKRLDVSCSFWFVSKPSPKNNTVTTAIYTCISIFIYINTTHRRKHCNASQQIFYYYFFSGINTPFRFIWYLFTLSLSFLLFLFNTTHHVGLRSRHLFLLQQQRLKYKQWSL